MSACILLEFSQITAAKAVGEVTGYLWIEGGGCCSNSLYERLLGALVLVGFIVTAGRRVL